MYWTYNLEFDIIVVNDKRVFDISAKNKLLWIGTYVKL